MKGRRIEKKKKLIIKNLLFRCILNLLEKWTYQAQSCPKCHKNVLYSRSYIALLCS